MACRSQTKGKLGHILFLFHESAGQFMKQKQNMALYRLALSEGTNHKAILIFYECFKSCDHKSDSTTAITQEAHDKGHLHRHKQSRARINSETNQERK